ncbi:MAG: carboxymuconolactone decarboxylase family protein [Planctomycetota bacterium]
MAWIRQVSEEDADGSLAQIYDAARRRAGRVFNILRVMSLRPRSLGTFMRFYTDLMQSADSPLSRAERELLATVTSQVNGCFY